MKPEIKLLWSTPDPEYQIIRAARICYQSEEETDSRWEPTGDAHNILMGSGIKLGVPLVKVKLGIKDEKLLNKLMTNEHNSTLRFASAAFNIKGISRVCSHQLVRIAHFGILQKSDRYSGANSEVLPESLIGLDDELDHLVSKFYVAYEAALEKGVPEEDARYLLPSGSCTEMNMVSNFQGWKHMLALRLNKKVQKETRLVAAELCKQLYELAPIVFENDYTKLDKVGL